MMPVTAMIHFLPTAERQNITKKGPSFFTGAGCGAPTYRCAFSTFDMARNPLGDQQLPLRTVVEGAGAARHGEKGDAGTVRGSDLGQPRGAPRPVIAKGAPMTRPTTLGELKASGWVSRPVKDEVRANAIERIVAGRPLVDGVLGYEDTVLPQLENALLAGHDVILLGERGQAKTRIIRSLTELLDEWMPIVAGSEINDDPYAPISSHARTLIEEQGDDNTITLCRQCHTWVENNGKEAQKQGYMDREFQYRSEKEYHEKKSFEH